MSLIKKYFCTSSLLNKQKTNNNEAVLKEKSNKGSVQDRHLRVVKNPTNINLPTVREPCQMKSIPIDHVSCTRGILKKPMELDNRTTKRALIIRSNIHMNTENFKNNIQHLYHLKYISNEFDHTSKKSTRNSRNSSATKMRRKIINNQNEASGTSLPNRNHLLTKTGPKVLFTSYSSAIKNDHGDGPAYDKYKLQINKRKIENKGSKINCVKYICSKSKLERIKHDFGTKYRPVFNSHQQKSVNETWAYNTKPITQYNLQTCAFRTPFRNLKSVSSKADVDAKPNTMSGKSTGNKPKNTIACPPNACVPGMCKPESCLQLLKQKESPPKRKKTKDNDLLKDTAKPIKSKKLKESSGPAKGTKTPIKSKSPIKKPGLEKCRCAVGKESTTFLKRCLCKLGITKDWKALQPKLSSEQLVKTGVCYDKLFSSNTSLGRALKKAGISKVPCPNINKSVKKLEDSASIKAKSSKQKKSEKIGIKVERSKGKAGQSEGKVDKAKSKVDKTKSKEDKAKGKVDKSEGKLDKTKGKADEEDKDKKDKAKEKVDKTQKKTKKSKEKDNKSRDNDKEMQTIMPYKKKSKTENKPCTCPDPCLPPVELPPPPPPVSVNDTYKVVAPCRPGETFTLVVDGKCMKIKRGDRIYDILKTQGEDGLLDCPFQMEVVGDDNAASSFAKSLKRQELRQRPEKLCTPKKIAKPKTEIQPTMLCRTNQPVSGPGVVCKPNVPAETCTPKDTEPTRTLPTVATCPAPPPIKKEVIEVIKEPKNYVKQCPIGEVSDFKTGFLAPSSGLHTFGRPCKRRKAKTPESCPDRRIAALGPCLETRLKKYDQPQNPYRFAADRCVTKQVPFSCPKEVPLRTVGECIECNRIPCPHGTPEVKICPKCNEQPCPHQDPCNICGSKPCPHQGTTDVGWICPKKKRGNCTCKSADVKKTVVDPKSAKAEAKKMQKTIDKINAKNKKKEIEPVTIVIDSDTLNIRNVADLECLQPRDEYDECGPAEDNAMDLVVKTDVANIVNAGEFLEVMNSAKARRYASGRGPHNNVASWRKTEKKQRRAIAKAQKMKAKQQKDDPFERTAAYEGREGREERDKHGGAKNAEKPDQDMKEERLEEEQEEEQDEQTANTKFLKKKQPPCQCGARICRQERRKKRKVVKPRKIGPCICESSVCQAQSRKQPEFIEKENEIKQKALEEMKKKAAKLKETKKRLKKYAKQDANAIEDRARQDRKKQKEVEKYKHVPQGVLVAETVVDIAKCTFSAFTGLLKRTVRLVLHPKVAAYKFQEAREDPRAAMARMHEDFLNSSMPGTFKRVKTRVSAMPSTRYLVSAMESHPATNYLVHINDKDPKLKYRKIKRRKVPMDFECSPYMASLRQKPCLWIYYLCPGFYPHCVSLLNMWRQFTDMLLFVLAVGVWSPCILMLELCRAVMCCLFCSGGG
ncbi:uncharacterized protein LOC142973149 [Anticarsia gemmatalis]|uniref:uncharacterized protein LOC142973149 n=1 Tax=Anticarsia gemmatalis TaxID=129554 RepID=UPI003F772AA2